MNGDTWKRLGVFASHWLAVPGHSAGALPEQVTGLASGERVDVLQPSAGLGKGEVGEEAESGIGGREWCGRDDIADDEEDVDGQREQRCCFRHFILSCCER